MSLILTVQIINLYLIVLNSEMDQKMSLFKNIISKISIEKELKLVSIHHNEYLESLVTTVLVHNPKLIL